jgi:hypothetical protein
MLSSACLSQLHLLRRLVDVSNIRILQHLLCRSCKRLLVLRLVVEQERQFLQSLAERLREEKVDKHHLEAKPANVHQQVLPANVRQAYRIDEAACGLLGKGFMYTDSEPLTEHDCRPGPELKPT